MSFIDFCMRNVWCDTIYHIEQCACHTKKNSTNIFERNELKDAIQVIRWKILSSFTETCSKIIFMSIFYNKIEQFTSHDINSIFRITNFVLKFMEFSHVNTEKLQSLSSFVSVLDKSPTNASKVVHHIDLLLYKLCVLQMHISVYNIIMQLQTKIRIRLFWCVSCFVLYMQELTGLTSKRRWLAFFNDFTWFILIKLHAARKCTLFTPYTCHPYMHKWIKNRSTSSFV